MARTCFVGNKYTLTSGVTVEVTEYNNCFDVLIADRHGNTKRIGSSELLKGYVSWPWKDDGSIVEPRSALGDEYTLNNGISVKVSKILDTDTVEIRDNLGNSRSVGIEQLKTGSVSWREFGVQSSHKRSTPVRVGDKKTQLCGISLTVEAYIDCENVTVVDGFGNSRSVPASEFRRAGVGWSMFGHSKWDYLKPKKGRFYVYFVENAAGEILYIGKGKGNRYTHPTSGTSHVLELNRMFFNKEPIVVSIFMDDLDEETALSVEKQQIQSLNPRLNTIGKLHGNKKALLEDLPTFL